MTDKSVVFRKLTSLREHVTRMRRRRSDDLESFKLDTDRQDAIGMSLLVAVQDALDIALHMASDEGWGVAASYADSFGMLGVCLQEKDRQARPDEHHPQNVDLEPEHRERCRR